ncbi:hypothetical protein QOZ80_1BG0079830 [Eleusine coracana subsp. coracana]|nr:hypothetical protein QOZ80_1BG0079830 [Eleusine coracana subsp. coracana]
MAFAVAPPLPLSSATGGWRRRPWATAPRFVVVACTRDVGPVPRTFGRLREQLLQLHAEADLTQSKANSARTRLVRLTEAAENLKKRAANSVSIGKESEAVDLLVQKKKLTKALESIKERIEVLDKLSAKISEAISLKQNMLIQCALRPETPDGEISDDKIRVFSSKINDGADGTERIFPKYETEQFMSSQLVEEVDNERQIDGKWHRLSDILKLVKETRERIARILDATAEENKTQDLR